jgi:hypothetical protein
MSCIFLNLHLFIFFLPLFTFENEGVIWDYCNCILNNSAACNVSSKVAVLNANIFHRVSLSHFEFLLQILDPSCSCLEGELFTVYFQPFTLRNQLRSFRSRMRIK